MAPGQRTDGGKAKRWLERALTGLRGAARP